MLQCFHTNHVIKPDQDDILFNWSELFVGYMLEAGLL